MSVKVFYCYAHEDRALRAELEKHLANLKRQELIIGWYDRNISAGKDWEKEIDVNLNTANLILLLISPDFMNSDYCYSVEMQRALERHDRAEARVIPIILRHVDYEGAPFARLQALPTDRVPVIDRKWHNRGEALFNVAQGIRKVVKELLCMQCLNEGNIHFYRQQYNEALTFFEQAIYLDSANALAYIRKGQVLNELGLLQDILESADYYQGALAAFEQATKCLDLLDTLNSVAYEGKGKALHMLHIWGRFEKAEILEAYEFAISFDQKNEAAYIGQGDAFMNFYDYEEALVAYEKAIEVALFPNQAAYKGKIEALCKLNQYEKALTVCEQFIQEFPTSSYPYSSKGEILYNLKRYEEALQAYNLAIFLGFQSAPLYTKLGNLFCQLGNHQKALDAFEQAIRLDSDFSEAYEGKGNVLKTLAEKAFEEAKDKLPF